MPSGQALATGMIALVAEPPSTVLIADDEPRLRNLMAKLLRARGYAVLAARDADEAARLLGDPGRRIDVAVLDARIAPDGCEPLLGVLLAAHPAARLVLVSGSHLEAGLQQLARSRGAAVLYKPFAVESLVQAVAGERAGAAA